MIPDRRVVDGPKSPLISSMSLEPARSRIGQIAEPGLSLALAVRVMRDAAVQSVLNRANDQDRQLGISSVLVAEAVHGLPLRSG
jgi:hypothetical protein